MLYMMILLECLNLEEILNLILKENLYSRHARYVYYEVVRVE